MSEAQEVEGSIAQGAGCLGKVGHGLPEVTDARGVRAIVRSLVDVLCAVEHAVYRLIVVPLVAFLPAPIAYGLARLRGDWCYLLDWHTRERIMRNLADVLGDQLRPIDQAGVTRDFLRRRSCEAMDVTRLAGKGRALMRLIDIHGLQHLEAALAKGKGAIVCSAHFGQFAGAFSLLGARGFPVTAVGNWPATDEPDTSRVRRVVTRLFYERPLDHHRRPQIEPGKAGALAAIRVAEVLRANEVVCIPIDAPIMDPKESARTVQVDFLGRQVRLLPGTVSIAQRTGAPVLIAVVRRSQDWRHQVAEISPPVPIDGDPVAAFKRCVAMVEAPIHQNPAHWAFWDDRQVLVNLGLLPGQVVKSPRSRIAARSAEG